MKARLPPEIGAVVRKAIEVAEASFERPAKDSAETPLQIPGNVRRADALRLISETFLAHHGEESGAGASADRVQVVVHIDEAILAEGHAAKDDEPHRRELEDGPLALDTARRLACDATIVGIVEGEVGRAARHRSQVAQHSVGDRASAARPRRRLPLPGVRSHAFLRRAPHQALGQWRRDEAQNLVTLCRFHHRLVHEGGYGVRRTDDGVFVFTRPDGRRVEANGAQSFRGNNLPSRESTYRGFEDSLRIHMLNREAGLKIDAETSRCQWRGEPIDYSQAIEAMQFLET